MSAPDSQMSGSDTPARGKPRMPALFLAHGSPMNALADNDFTRALSRLAHELPVPDAILVVSAHWLTRGTRVPLEGQTQHDLLEVIDDRAQTRSTLVENQVTPAPA